MVSPFKFLTFDRPKLSLFLVAAALLAAGCDLPLDPEGTFERVQGGVLRVGIVHHPPWATVEGEATSGGGIERILVERLAEEIGARVEWHLAGESLLMESLEKFELDLVVGGLHDASPWGGRVGLTRAYVEAPLNPCVTATTAATKRVGHVFAVPPGENAWILRVESFLERMRPEAAQLIAQACDGHSNGEPWESDDGAK